MNKETEREHIEMLVTTFCQFHREEDTQSTYQSSQRNTQSKFISIEHDDISSGTSDSSSSYNDPNSNIKTPISWGY